jgi:hypothetical protein
LEREALTLAEKLALDEAPIPKRPPWSTRSESGRSWACCSAACSSTRTAVCGGPSRSRPAR